MINSKKICLGTSQFSDIIYGATNLSKPLSVNYIKKILNFCIKKKITYLDLSLDDKDITYLNVNKKILKTKVNMNKFNLILKVKLKKSYKENLKLMEEIKKFKKKFKIHNIYSILIHNIKDFEKKDLKYINAFFVNLVKFKICKFYGISIYSIKEFYLLYKNKVKINIIQLPYNYLDRSSYTTKEKNIFTKNKIKVFFRSIFLQGILLESFSKLNTFFSRWEKYFKNFENCIRKNKLNKLTFNINFALNKKPEAIILGIVNLIQINEILKVKKTDKLYYDKIQTVPSNLNKPYNWPKKIYIKKI